MYQEFVKGEKVYFSVFPWLILAWLLLLFFVFLIVLSADSKPVRKRALVIGLVFTLPFGAYCLAQGPLALEYAKLEPLANHPAVREYRVSLAGARYYHPLMEKRTYLSSYLPDFFQQLPFYQEKPVQDKVTYLGRSGDKAYLALNQTVYQLPYQVIRFSADTDQATLSGVYYDLVDPAFVTQGFDQSSPKYLQDFLVPLEEEDLTASEETLSLAINKLDGGARLGTWRVKQ